MKPVPKSQDAVRDQVLKLRMRRIFWCQGYYCPLEVDLSHFEYEETGKTLKRSPITDIDALAIRFDPDMRKRVIVADCKSGQESEPNRLFWLKGVMTFFGAQEGFLVKTKIHAHARALAPKLDVRVLDQAALDTLEDSICRGEAELLSDKEIDDKARNLWGISVPEGQSPSKEQLALKNVYQYLQYLYWMVEEYRNISTLMDRFGGISPLLDPNELRHKYLAYIGLQRLALSIMTMASEVSARDVNDVVRQSKTYMLGGAFLLREREHIISLLNKIAGDDLLGEKFSVEPPYFPELVEIVNRVLRNARESVKILQHLEAVTIAILLGGRVEIKGVLGNQYSTDALVMGKRIADMMAKYTKMDRKLFSELDYL